MANQHPKNTFQGPTPGLNAISDIISDALPDVWDLQELEQFQKQMNSAVSNREIEIFKHLEEKLRAANQATMKEKANHKTISIKHSRVSIQ
jgi:hypothetical protein